jgi:NitT/TauT family transport system permease protein
MKAEPKGGRAILLALGVLLLTVGIWQLLFRLRLWPEASFPSPMSVVSGFQKEIASGRLLDNMTASLFRVTVGFLLAVLVSVPVGLGLGHQLQARAALLPYVNFLRNLSPIAWIPFAVLWFGVGDPPAIFLVFYSAVFPMALSVTAAVANIPSVYFQVARDHGLRGVQLLTRVTLPAIMPQFITTLRVTVGVAWMVVVAAEMLAGKDGLGWAVWDSRNGLMMNILIVQMVVIGLIGVALDRLLVRLTRVPAVRWGYER